MHDKPKILTLGDLKYSQRIYAHCEGCKRSVPLDVRLLVERYGARLTIAQLRRRVKCGDCGKRTGDIRIMFGTVNRS